MKTNFIHAKQLKEEQMKVQQKPAPQCRCFQMRLLGGSCLQCTRICACLVCCIFAQREYEIRLLSLQRDLEESNRMDIERVLQQLKREHEHEVAVVTTKLNAVKQQRLGELLVFLHACRSVRVHSHECGPLLFRCCSTCLLRADELKALYETEKLQWMDKVQRMLAAHCSFERTEVMLTLRTLSFNPFFCRHRSDSSCA